MRCEHILTEKGSRKVSPESLQKDLSGMMILTNAEKQVKLPEELTFEEDIVRETRD